MRCLVSGGAGFIGSWVVDSLIEAGHDVLIIDNLSTGDTLNPRADFIQEDIESRNLWNVISRYDMVFHLASLARIQPSIQNPLPAHETNVNGTLNVLEYCRRHKSKIIFSSSSSLYKGLKLPSSEEDEIEPKNPYSLQKYVCEQYIELYHKLYGLEYAILRYFNVFGERQITEGAYAAIIGIFLKQKSEGKPLTITGDGEQRRDFTYVKDVARANLMAMNWQGTFNIGTGENFSINQIADMVGGEKKYIDPKPGEVRNTLADYSKAKQLGWEPTVSISEWNNENS